MIASLVLALLVTCCGCRRGVRQGDAADHLRSSIVLVGFDGLDWVLLDRLIAEGRCPAFAEVKARGAWADLVSHEPLLSPLIWTSIATGRPPEAHGIIDFVQRDPDSGRDVPVSSRMRQVPAFWNLLSDAGRCVHVVNWWATHPVEPISGVMVSERPFVQLPRIGEPQIGDGDVFPATARDRARSCLAPAHSISSRDLASMVELSEAEIETRLAQDRLAEAPYEDPLVHLRAMVASTRGVFALARSLAVEGDFDLLALYVEGTDTVGHRFAHCLPPRLPWVGADEYAAYSHTMERYYELCDRELGSLIEVAPPETTWLIAADHGFHTGAVRPSCRPDDFGAGAAQWHRMVGVFIAAGPCIAPGQLPRAAVDDLCRTILWLADVEIADELEGRELVELVQPEWAAKHPPRRVPSYGGRPRPWLQSPASRSEEVDAARLAELEALGYVEAPRGEACDRPGRGETHTTIFNRAKLAERSGNLAEAERLFRESLELEPTFVFAMLELYGLAHDAGNHDQALYWLAQAISTCDARLPDRVVVAFAREAETAGRVAGARVVLDAMPAEWHERPAWRTAIGHIERAQGGTVEALGLFTGVLDQHPGFIDALDGLVMVGGEDALLGRFPAAFAEVATDLDRLPRLARLCARHGLFTEAERCLTTVLESDPGNRAALRDLARVHEAEGRWPEAVAAAERLVALMPEDEDAQDLLQRLLDRAALRE